MPSALLERSFSAILVVVALLVVALVVLRIVIGAARRSATQRTDALLKRTLETAAPNAPEQSSAPSDSADRD